VLEQPELELVGCWVPSLCREIRCATG